MYANNQITKFIRISRSVLLSGTPRRFTHSKNSQIKPIHSRTTTVTMSRTIHLSINFPARTSRFTRSKGGHQSVSFYQFMKVADVELASNENKILTKKFV